ncbi:MAG: GH1 family beta-glucosidase [Micromonosporaceae bacterium]
MTGQADAGFLWGVATSAYQIEGATSEDGRTPSIWDTFCERPGAIEGGASGETACDHYHRVGADLDLIAGLGVGAYRFSTSWSRIQPYASGEVNPRGLDFYDRLVDGLAARGLAPVLTAYHWDLPQWAQDAGGWQQRDTASRFADYVGVLADRLGDRVGIWITLNEPFEHTVFGHLFGSHAPGLELPLDQVMTVAHHQLLGHGLAVAALRTRTSRPVMLVNSYAPAWPGSSSSEDQAAAGLYDAIQNQLFTDPVLRGAYPETLAPLLEGAVADGDLEVISAPIDALGVNYYSVNTIHAADGPVPIRAEPAPDRPRTGFDWAIVPEGLTETLTTLRDRYADALPPVYLSENGCSYPDELVDGRCDDPERIAYLDAHLTALRVAMDAGVDVRGYFVWSLLDNFEWAAGYGQRFGLVHVDYPTQRRTPKQSYRWFRQVVRDAPAG